MADAITPTRRLIVQMIAQDPTISAADIARAVGVSRARVSRLLAEMGYTLRRKWEKPKRQ